MVANRRALSLITIFALVSLLLVGAAAQFLTPAYGHGLSGDMPPPASIGDRKVTVPVKMTPPFLFAESPQDATIEMKFINVDTGQNIPHVTYFVTLNKGDKVLMSDWFHDHEGNLLIKVRPKDTDTTTIFGEKEPILEGWMRRGDVPVIAEGPIFLDGGMYHFAIEIFSIDNDKTILDPPLKYDAYVSIGETSTYPVTDGAEQRVSIRTYYDKIQGFDYDEQNKLIKFSTPFNWDMQFLSLVPLVHEEVIIPRSFGELVADKYTATVNNIRLPQDTILLDDVDPDNIIVHYLIPNQRLMQLAQQLASSEEGSSDNIAEFSLAPGNVEIGSPLMGGEIAGKIQATSSSGSITATLSWSPTTIEPGNPTTFSFTFTDALRNKPLRDVSYEFMLVKDGQELTKRQGQTVGGTTSEQFSFSESQAGSVTLRLENLNNTGESVSFDIQVVPEFPLSALIIMAGLVATVLGLTKFKNILTVRREY